MFFYNYFNFVCIAIIQADHLSWFYRDIKVLPGHSRFLGFCTGVVLTAFFYKACFVLVLNKHHGKGRCYIPGYISTKKNAFKSHIVSLSLYGMILFQV